MASTPNEERQVQIIVNAQQANASIKDMGAAVALMGNQLAKMAADDPRREQLKKDFQELKARVKEARAEIDGYLKSEEQLRQEAEALAQTNAATIQQGQRVTASYKEMKDAAGLLEKQLELLTADDPGRAAMIADFQELKARMAATKAEFTDVAKSEEQLRQEAEALAESQHQLVRTGQQAGASLTQLKDAAGVLEKQLHELSGDDPGRAAMIRDYQVLQRRIGEAKDEVGTYVQTEQELREETERVNRENQQVILNGQRVAATFNEMDAAAKKLEAQLKDLSADDPGRKKMLADYQALQERLEGAKKEMGSATEESSFLTQALAFGGVTLGAEAVLEGVMAIGESVVETTKEVTELRQQINQLTSASGQELDQLTADVLAVSRTFGKDFNEVLAASNTLSKQMGVSQQEALRLVQQGFIAGADAGGEFLDQVKEYAPQFKAAGASAGEFVGHLAQAAKEGVFSDKGADVVKEFGLRIREQTKATTDAMQAAFGKDFTDKIFGGIRDGSLSTTEALRLVAKEMDETKIPANQLQTIVADVFGGPGEDAGLAYIKSLKNVGKAIDEQVDKTNPYQVAQQKLLESNRELAQAQNALTKEFEGSGNVWQRLTNAGQTFLYSFLTSLISTIKELFVPVQDVWQAFAELAATFGLVSEKGITAADVGKALAFVIRLIFTPARLLYTAFAELVKVTAEWVQHNETARTVLMLLTQPFRTFYDLLENGPAYLAGFTAAFGAAFDRIGQAWELFKSGDFAGAKAAFASRGEAAARAFRQAFDAALAEKANSAASSENAGDEGNPVRTQGGDGLSEADRAKAEKDKATQAAKEKARRDKVDQARLDAIKQWVKAEGDVLQHGSELERLRQEQANTDELKRRKAQRDKIVADADKKYQDLLVLEGNHTLEMQAVLDERDLALREQQAKWDEQDKAERQKQLDAKLKEIETDTTDAITALEDTHTRGLVSEQEYQEQLYELTRQGLEKRLALLVAAGQGQTEEAAKIRAALGKGDKDHLNKKKEQEQELAAFNQKMAAQGAHLLAEGLRLVEDNLDKKSEAYQVFKAARKAAELAELGINLAAEIQAIWKASSENPLNGLTAGGAGVAQGTLLTGLAVARATAAGIRIASFAQGGETGPGLRPGLGAGTPGFWSMLRTATGLSVAPGGQLHDAEGLEVAGIVHKNEYVIPEWLRADPQVMQVEGWLEARRQRGFYQGGPTSEGDARPAAALPTEAGSQAQLVQVLASLDQRLRQVEDWPTHLEVVLDLLGLDREQEKLKQVKTRSGVKG